MKKNYITVFHKAEKVISRIATLILIVLATTLTTYAQSSQKNQSSFSSLKGPFDNITGQNTLDASPPVITYTPLTSTCTTGSRTLVATITDADGVPQTGAGAPRLYWQVNSGIFNAAPGTYIGSNQFSFTLGGTAVPGNLVSYYIVAQDNVGNVIAKPSAGATGYSINPPAVATSPASPDFYVVQTTLTTGTYNVGIGQTYVTLTDAVNAYNNSCLNGPVTFVLMDATYDVSETFPITISNVQASSVNTLTIKPNTGINAIVQGASSEAIIKLNGADYITIDGSNSGGTSRNLTFTNTSTNLTSTVIWTGSASASNGATNNTIKNCAITGNAATTTLAGIMQASGLIAGNPAETANGNNTYLNNTINTCYYGIYVIGPAAGESNTLISNNVVGSTQTAKKLGYRGVYISNQTNVQVAGNTINGVVSSIGVGSDVEPTGGIIVAGAISGGSVSGNVVNDIRNTSVAGYPAYGISLQSSTAAANFKVFNNMIHTIIGNGNASVPGNNGIGIALISGGGYGIYFNSVNLFSDQSLTGSISAAIFIGPSITGTASVDLRNNIFSNVRSVGSGYHYAIYCSVPNIIFSNINYNDYFYKTPGGSLGYLGTPRTTLANWQAATGTDGNSVAVNPVYVSNTDLHLNLISSLNNQGTPIAGITTDIDATTRSTTVPDIGADEINPPPCSGNTGGTAVSDFMNVCSSGTVLLSASGFSYGLGIAYQWQWSTTSATAGFSNITGETNPTSLNSPVINQTTWYRLMVTCSAGSPGYSNVVKVTVYNPQLLSSTPGTRCGPGSVNLSATGTAGTVIQWYPTLTGGTPLYTGNTFATPSISTTTPYYAESVFLGSSGTVGLNNPTLAPDISTQLISWQVYFNVIQATKLLTVDVYPLAAGEFSQIDIYNSSNVIIGSASYTTTVSGGATVQTVDMGGIALPIGTGYYLYATGGIPPTGLTRNLSGATYPYSSTDIVITGNAFNNNYYMCYYNWRFTNGCSSTPRTAVNANIGVSASLNVTASASSICAGQSTNLNVASSNPSYSYTWLPGPLSGAPQTVSPAATTTYTVNATDGTCTGTGNITITVNPASSDVTIAPTAVSRCVGSTPVMLTATGGDITGVPILSENFNGASTPAGWSTVTNWTTPTPSNSTGTVANSAWTLRPNNYTWAAGGVTFRSNDLSQFYLSNSDANAGITRTALISPSFSLTGYTSVNLNFWQYFASAGEVPTATTGDSICVEISQNGTTWTNIYSTRNSKGLSSINWNNANISLTPWLGNTTNYLRFRYYGTDDYQWAIDNVNVTGDNGGAPITWSPIGGLFTNPGGTNPYSAGYVTSTVYANPSSTTTYTATATPVNACAATKTINVTINAVGATLTPSLTLVCPNAQVDISVALTGTGPWNFTYSDGVTPVTVNNVATSPYVISVFPSTTTTYSITALNDVNCTATAAQLATMTTTITVTASAVSTWQGVTSNWNSLSNWCGGIPTATRDVVIPVTANSPVISGVTGLSRDITIASGASLTIASGATYAFKGNMTNNGTLINNGTITLNGSTAQSFPGGSTGTITAMNILEINNTAGASINKKLTITGALLPTAGNITLNDTIRLHSDATATARVGTLGASAGFTYSGLGKFSIERFISSNVLSGGKVGWRFLAAPVAAFSNQTINQAWQEGQAAGVYTGTGYGMQIVGPSSAGAGFDQNTTTSSLKTYNPASATPWVSVPGTSGPIARVGGYMAFIRGDRSANTFGSSSATTLRTTGRIQTGTIGPVSTANPNEFISLGNPYPSAIDFTALTKNGLRDVYYLWDPKIGLYGGYQTFDGALSYNPQPGGNSYSGGNKFIESGQAFFVLSNTGAAPHNLSFTESAKVAGSYQVQRIAGSEKQLATRLYIVSDSSTILADGNMLDFDAAYSNDVDDFDVPKLSNFGENIGILSRGQTLVIEHRSEIINTDTVFYQLGQLRQQTYHLEFTPQNLAGLSAWLEDNYLQASTPINMSVVSIVDFIVNAEPASRAADRFRLVFRQLAPVPVSFMNIAAYRREKNIVVNWKVGNEINIDHYEIERSPEGRSFEKIAVQPAKGNNNGAEQEYSSLDTKPFDGVNYYRIRSVGIASDIKYSEIVKVNVDTDASLIVVYPNPVKDGIIGVSFNNQEAGDYDIKVFAANGQLTAHQQIYYQGGSEKIKIPAGPNVAKGVYNLEIIMPAKKRRIFKVVIE